MDLIFDPLMQYGALGLFCLFLISQFILQNKKIDKQNEKFTKSLEDLRKSHLEREEALRAEYHAQNNLLRTENENIKQNHAEIFAQFRSHVTNAHGHHKEQMGKLRTAIQLVLDEDRNWRQEEKLRMVKRGELV
ncbi:hypothetical protein CL634_09315 [bacterium]|nr:hypothetical protein [bacterium]